MKVLGIIILLVSLLSLFDGLVSPSGAETSVVVLGYLFKFVFIILGFSMITKANNRYQGTTNES